MLDRSSRSVGPACYVAFVRVADCIGKGSAAAAGTDGFSALSLAALVGEHSPRVSAAEKTLLASYLDGNAAAAHAPGQRVGVRSDGVTCRASDVDIAAYSCTLYFGEAEIALEGRAAQNLFATLAEVGVPSDGAAGSIYEGVTKLSCVIDADEVSDTGGGGAHCDFAPG